ncbi:hypothetical protein M0P65_07475, partial [Candidatus Gracilibacteria bacterium]|nr:hypothetical protein [Candidatus Gracilibacteria bacterium]
LCFEPIEKSDKLIKKKSDTKSIEIVKIRQAFADYVATEGCSCCRDIDGHEKALKQIATLLKMKKYKDGSGYDYSRYKSKELK